MKFARRPDLLSFSPPRSLARRSAGFLLLGLSAFVCAVGLGIFFGTPYVQQARQKTRSTAVLRDLRAFAERINAYARDRGDWPAAGANPGDPPDGLEKIFATTNWQQPTPIGGHYVWAPNSMHQGERYHAVIVIADLGPDKVTTARSQLEDIDRQLDDGNLSTGKFRLGYRNYPMFVIEH